MPAEQPAELPEPDDRRALLRAANADRELVHQILSAAMANGSLTPDEYQERSGKAVMAKTFGDLDELTDDLPVTQLGVPLPGVPDMTATSRVSSGSGQTPVRHRLAIMSGSQLKGAVAVADTLTATAIAGGVEIDLREVEFTAPILTVQCTAIMGGVDIVVPPDVTVEVGGLAIMGGFGDQASGAGAPGAPTVRVTGFALMGGVDVKRKEPREGRKRR
ncbi:DUF1707 domain-containing protein [Gordonia sinesedis]